MDTVTAEKLQNTLREAVRGYATLALNGVSYFMSNEDARAYAVVFIGETPHERIADAGLIARVADDRIIIEQDMGNKPLVETLIASGVPREQIVLAYAGERI
jgi:hypothetical protein